MQSNFLFCYQIELMTFAVPANMINVHYNYLDFHIVVLFFKIELSLDESQQRMVQKFPVL